jgi:uncharacterized protein
VSAVAESAGEIPILFDCAGSTLLGILHPATVPARRGVLIVVGGPQYRIGSHRQFVLLARALAKAGIPAMRFDYRGMGDSDGPFRGFEEIGADIEAALAAFRSHSPELKEVILWGLCDAASAIMFYAHRDPAIAGIVLLNPWVRTDVGEAKTYIKHYYRGRLADPAFWRKALSGKLDLLTSGRSLAGFARSALRRSNATPIAGDLPLPERMAAGLERYRGPVLLILSGNDLTAREFEEAARDSRWTRLLKSPFVRHCPLEDSDHTFSRKEWRQSVVDSTVNWITRIPESDLYNVTPALAPGDRTSIK